MFASITAAIIRRIIDIIINTSISFNSVFDSVRVFLKFLFLIILISIFVIIKAAANARIEAEYSKIPWGIMLVQANAKSLPNGAPIDIALNTKTITDITENNNPPTSVITSTVKL